MYIIWCESSDSYTEGTWILGEEFKPGEELRKVSVIWYIKNGEKK